MRSRYWRGVWKSDGFDLEGLEEITPPLNGLITCRFESQSDYRTQIVLYAKFGIHEYNARHGKNLQFSCMEKFNYLPEFTQFRPQEKPLEPSSNQEEEEEPEPYNYGDKILPEWPSENALRDKSRFYLLKKSDLKKYGWIRLYLELAFFKANIKLKKLDLTKLVIGRVAVESRQENVEPPTERLNAVNSVIYIKYNMQTRSSSSASGELVPLGVQFPAIYHQLQIVDPISFRGKLLPGWTVVNHPRSLSPSNNGSVDTYFIEPGTGRQFPSLESVQRHLTRAGAFFREKTRVYEGSRTKQVSSVYEGSRTKQNHRSLEYASKSFRLPAKGWTIEEYPRKNSYHIDKYYVERSTGKRFRSLVSVERYLNESGNHADHQQPMLLQYHRVNSKDFSLPDGWIVEEKPRINSTHVDKTYIEPGTGNKFRSMAAVKRYLEATGNSTLDLVSMEHSERLSLTGFQAEVIDPNPPKKVKWVLTGSDGNTFTANMSGSDVSSSVKQKWSEAFVSLIQDRS
ncbi:hypothetical protein AALP_AA8G394200 [Arabis alpina]|uniref:MBD domain-containing protein n=1 Tax=Arabis alpina TaxID=50452 RepID=A0A087GCC1_ARAAL|nr:hypothetical protein AALP_AA8G394200 [Arabis alpina]